MKLTNKYKLPEVFVSAVQNDPYQRTGVISVTELIGPPQIRLLKRQYNAQLEEDVSDRIWSLLGQAVHEILQKTSGDNVLVEERLVADINGWAVGGRSDLWEPPGRLSDYKVTSVWSYIIGDRWEWQAQLNCYAFLYLQSGFPVNSIQNVLILRDWQASRVKESNYPRVQVVTLQQDLWSQAYAKEYMESRVKLHQKADEGDCPPCTDKERWAKPEKWVVKKKGQVKAVKWCDTEIEANDLASKYHFSVEHYPAVARRCGQYCDVAPFCPQGRSEWEKRNDC